MLTRIIAVAVGFTLTYLWLLLPEERFINPFPFNKGQQISVQTYFDYALARVFVLILFLVIESYFHHAYWKVCSWMALGYIIDYCLVYNSPYIWYSFKLHQFTKTEPDGWYIPFSWFFLWAATLWGMVIFEAFKSILK